MRTKTKNLMNDRKWLQHSLVDCLVVPPPQLRANLPGVLLHAVQVESFPSARRVEMMLQLLYPNNLLPLNHLET